jgi:hypothetical protein
VRSLSAPTLAALSASQLAMVTLVHMGFASPIALNSSNMDLVWSSVTYKGAGAMGAISQIEDSPGEIKGLSFQLIGVDSAYIALALDDAAVVQGTAVTIRTAILDSTYTIVDAPVEWTGKLDTMSIEEDGETCTISVSAESSAVDILRGGPLTYSDADQRSLYGNDPTFEFILPQANTPIVWPSKLWFQAVGPTR